MTVKLRALCVVSALSFLASLTCFSAYAAELLDRYSGDDDVYSSYEPVPDPTPQPDPEPDPTPQPDPNPDPEPDPTPQPDPDPQPDPTVSGEPDPVVSGDPDPTVSNTGSNSPTVSDLIDDSNFPSNNTSIIYSSTVSDYNDYNQNGGYVNPYTTSYDDNYVYVPSYTEPEGNLIDTSSKVINTDELTNDDWAKIILDLEKGNISDDGTKTFNFIKENNAQGDTSIIWMLYLGFGLIALSIFTVTFVIISTNVTMRRSKKGIV